MQGKVVKMVTAMGKRPEMERYKPLEEEEEKQEEEEERGEPLTVLKIKGGKGLRSVGAGI